MLQYVVLMGLASRKLGVPVRWTEDRVEHLLGSAAATGRVTTVEAGFTPDGELVALRYDAVEDVGAYVRAPEPATLYRMHGSLSGAYRVRNVAARNRVVLTNTLPSGLNRGFGGPQLYFGLERTMAIAARRLGLDPAELARRNLVQADEMPYRTPSGGLYDSGDYAACLDEALRRAGWAERLAEARAARAAGRLVGVGLACVVEPSISNMGYITLAQTAVERCAGCLRSPGNAEGALVMVSPLGGITVRLGTTPQGQGHRTVVAQVVADELGVDARGGDGALRDGHCDRPVDGRVGQLLVPLLGCGRRGGARGGAAAAPRRRPRSATTSATRSCRCAGSPAPRTGIRKGCPTAWSPGLAAVAYWAAPNLDPPDAEDRVASSGAHGLIVDVCSVEVDRDTGAVTVLDYVTVHDAGTLLNPMLADGQVRGGFAHGAAAALFERHVWDESGSLLTASFMDYLAPTAPDVPGLEIGHRSTPVAVHGPRRERARGGQHDVHAGGDRKRGRGRHRSRRPRAAADAAARVGAVGRQGRGVKPPPFEYVRAASLEEALAALADGGDGCQAAGGRAEPRAGAQHAPRSPDAARRPPARGTGRDRARERPRAGRRDDDAAGARAKRRLPTARARGAGPRGARGDTQPRHGRRVARTCRRRRRARPLPHRPRRRGGHRPARDCGRRPLRHGTFTTTLEPGELVVASTWPASAAACAFEELALRAGDYALAMVAVAR